MTINLNTNPYYDDYDESKNYLKVLFKPGYAVQARELTQLQTALQKQVTRFGSHIFKDGSIVLNGQTTRTTVQYVDIVVEEGTDLTVLSETTFTGETSNAGGRVFKYVRQSDTVCRVYFIYTTGYLFERAEKIVTSDSDEFYIVDEELYYGSAKAYSIVDSVFFVKGHFVFCNAQTIILYHDSEVVSVKVGLAVNESIVTYVDDSTLLDPAQGSYNYAAPGADRYTISLDLVAYEYDPADPAATSTEEFVELSRFVLNDLVYNVDKASYSDLETTLARRTYDESGDYTVKAFGLKVKEHIYEDEDYLSLALEPGKAYVKGYEFETIATNHINLPKARDFKIADGRGFQADHGSYFTVEIDSGTTETLTFTSNTEVYLRSGSTNYGTANVRAITAVSDTVFRLYVYNIDFDTIGLGSLSDIDNIYYSSDGGTHNWTANISAGTTLVNANRKSFIVPLPNTMIKSLEETGTDVSGVVGGGVDTTYTAHWSYESITIATNQIQIATGSSEKTFLGTSENDFVVVNASTGQPIEVTGVSGSGTSRTLTVALASGIADVYTTVSVANAEAIPKSLQTGSVTSNFTAGDFPTDPISLGVADCFKIVSVTAVDTTATLDDIDVTEYFAFDNGQTDEMYDYGSVTLKSVYTIDSGYNRFVVSFQYFSVTQSAGFYSVDSYGDIDYEDIPTYKSAAGNTYYLRDCLDFRPRRTGATTISGSYAVRSNTTLTADFSYYLSRIDKLVLTKERSFYVVKGLSAEVPAVPSDMPDAMTLYVLRVPAYTSTPSEVTFTYIDNRRYTMRDIAKFDKRLSRVEYYTSLSLLEKQAADESIYTEGEIVDRFKNGILVDSFAGHSVGDVQNFDYRCSVDYENRYVRPRFASYSFDYTLASISNGIKKGDLVTLPYDSDESEILVQQPYATGYVNCNPYMVFMWNGTMSVNPATDTWVDITTRPDVVVNLNGENDVYTTLIDGEVENPASVGVRWNDWQTVSRGVVTTDDYSTNQSTSTTTTDSGSTISSTTTTILNNQTTTVNETLLRTGVEISTSAVSTVTRDLGTKVVDTSIVPYIRSRAVNFSAKALKPNTSLFALFDGINVSDYCHRAVEIVFEDVSYDLSNVTKVRTGAKTLTVTVGGDTGGTTYTLNQTFVYDEETGTGSFVTGDDVSVSTEATIIMTSTDRVFVVVDDGCADIELDDNLEWYDSVEEAWVSSGTASAVYSDTKLMTNEKGEIAGVFDIPNNDNIKFRTGERKFRLADSAGTDPTTAAETTYVAQGMSQSVERTIVATRVATVSINPVQETVVKTSSSTATQIVSTSNVTVEIPAPPIIPEPMTGCGGSQRGGKGKFEYWVDFGDKIGECGITYSTGNIPDRFTLIWDGKTYGNGFTGNTSYNTQLANLGYPKITATAVNGVTKFFKHKASPAYAKLIVDAPLTGTGWSFNTFCSPWSSTNTPKYDITLSAERTHSNTLTTWTASPPSSYSFTMRVSLSAGSSSSNSGSVTLTSNRTGFTITPSTFTLQNGRSRTVTVTCNRSVAGLGDTTSFTGAITARVTEGSSWALTDSASHSWTWTVTRRIIVESGDWDPVAQTFFVDGRTYPNGVYVDKMDLYFRTKSTSTPITLQLRPVVNGYPSSTDIMPFGTCVKYPSDIETSDDASVATTFYFENIVHLAPGEYAFVAPTATDEYTLWTATLGEFSIEDSTQRVTTQPVLGSMFKSQNQSTWTATQEEDVKFTIYRVVFDIDSTCEVVFDTNIASNNGDVEYETFYSTGESVDFSTTEIGYFYKTMDTDENVDSWQQYQLGSNVSLNETKLLACDNQSSLQFKTTLTSSDYNVTPVIDVNRLSNVLVKNIINNDNTNEDGQIGGSALAKYVTRRVKLNSGFESRDIKVYFNADIPTGSSVEVYYKVSSISDTYFDDNDYVLMEVESAGTFQEGKFVEYKYKTPYVDSVDNSTIALESGDRFDTFSIKVVMLSDDATKIPRIRDLRALALDD